MKLSTILSDAAVSLMEAAGIRSKTVQNIIDEELQHFATGARVTNQGAIPDTTQIPIENPVHWLKIPNVIACFVDMEGSTKLSATTHERTTANAYRLFTNTAIRIFHHFRAEYIDVKGDGVFALYNEDRPYTALAATVSFKTFVKNEFTPRVQRQTGLTIGGHFGVDQRTVLVRKLGLKAYGGRTDRQNEVWAGKPVNMAAKLASVSSNNRLWVSDRYFKNLQDAKALQSCGCHSGGEPSPLWTEEDVSNDERFDFDRAFSVGSDWCEIHGKRYCAELVALDER
jgi:class 3 adenylate cyclase